MATKQILRGDSYGSSRNLYTYTFVDPSLNPLDLRGYKIQVTFKPVITTIETDPNDSTAYIKHEIQFNLAGTVTVQNGLYVVGAATGGVIQQRLTKVETAGLIPNVEMVGDLQLTDPNGEVVTWMFADKLIAVDAVTNRPPT